MLELPPHPSEVQHMGLPDDIDQCVLAVDTITNSENPPSKASIVTWKKDLANAQYHHFFLFWNWNDVPLTVVHSSFASGYGGGGPHRFSEALCMILYREIPTNEIVVSESEFKTIEDRILTVETIERLRAVDGAPLDFSSFYIMPRHREQTESEFWAERHNPKPVFDFLDPELSKRCRRLYSADPESAVFTAFKVVEERIHALVGESNNDEEDFTGYKLIQEALSPKKGTLADKNLSYSEKEGMHLMFRGAFQFIRNPRAHRIVDNQDTQLSIELIYLADLLLRILPKGPYTGEKASE